MKVVAAHATAPMVGEIANGDRAVFRTDDEQRALFAIIDGLGHGPDAAVASQAASDRLAEVSLQSSVLAIMEGLHEALKGSRGAAATVCVLRGDELEVCAVGNVELRTFDLRVPLVFTAGIVGIRIAKYHTCRARFTGKGRLVLFSDGISLRTPLEDVRSMPPSAACAEVMRKYRRKEDDATVLIADVG
jgi:negative regulator of sigma-B (phosphoserine phosphatase)